jgi:hypothetical protein
VTLQVKLSSRNTAQPLTNYLFHCVVHQLGMPFFDTSVDPDSVATEVWPVLSLSLPIFHHSPLLLGMRGILRYLRQRSQQDKQAKTERRFVLFCGPNGRFDKWSIRLDCSVLQAYGTQLFRAGSIHSPNLAPSGTRSLPVPRDTNTSLPNPNPMPRGRYVPDLLASQTRRGILALASRAVVLACFTGPRLGLFLNVLS